MKIIVLFAVNFLEPGFSIIEDIQQQHSDIEVLALSSSTKIHESVKKALEGSIKAKFYNMEKLEKEWVSTQTTLEKLQLQEKVYGADVLNRTVIADRHIGAAYSYDAEPIDSLFRKKIKNKDSMKNYISGMVSFFETLITEEKPDVCLMHCVAGGYTYCLAKIVKAHNVRFYQLQPCRIENLYMLDTSAEGRMEPAAELLDNALKTPSLIHEEHYASAKDWLKAFREKLDVLPEYEVENRENKKKSDALIPNFIRMLKAGKGLLRSLFVHDQTFREKSHIQKFLFTLKYPARLWRMSTSSWFMSEEDIYGRPYLFFPLHVSPESSTMVLSPHHTQQLSIIEGLSKSAPLSMNIVVKEHPMMSGHRRLSFYKNILDLPNVTLVETNANTQRLIKNATIVATITGTAGWEALVRQKPLIVMGDPTYKALKDGFVYCPDISDLSNAIQKCLTLSPCPNKVLETYIAALFQIGFPMESSLLLYFKTKDMNDSKHKPALRRITSTILGDTKSLAA